MKTDWTKYSWKKYTVKQQPEWKDKDLYKNIISQLEKLPSLVFSGETRNLKTELKDVHKGTKFILQAGNCAELFSDCHGPSIHNFLRIMLQMSMVIEYCSQKNVIQIGRIAGQYAKPRSSNYEIIEGKQLPSYRGDIVNESEPIEEARKPNPQNLLEAYFRSAATLNLIRAFIQGGYAEINNLYDWKQHFYSDEIAQTSIYKGMEDKINKSLRQKNNKKSIYNNNRFYTSHECLLLNYEEAFTRIDTTYGGYYDTSAHFLWIGDRTRNIDGAHIEFVRGIGNPIGLKIGPNHNVDEIIKIVKRLNPSNSAAKIALIIRMGANNIIDNLKPLIKIIKNEKLNVIWMSDPMHGNTFKHKNFKVRNFKDIVKELTLFFNLCKEFNIIPGGVHLEITSEKVTECIGGIDGLDFSHLNINYETKVDPRLNAAQALELAFIIGNLLTKFKEQ